jgi:hypothetical protein
MRSYLPSAGAGKEQRNNKDQAEKHSFSTFHGTGRSLKYDISKGIHTENPDFSSIISRL